MEIICKINNYKNGPQYINYYYKDKIILTTTGFGSCPIYSLEINKLIQKFKINTIIETGTKYGQSTLDFYRMSQNSDTNKNINIHTIEYDKKNFNECQTYLNTFYGGKKNNIYYHLGDSKIVLKELFSKCNLPIIFYLDAHDSAFISDNKNKKISFLELIYNKKITIEKSKLIIPEDYSPKPYDKKENFILLKELELILENSKNESIIIIDDFYMPNQNCSFGFIEDNEILAIDLIKPILDKYYKENEYIYYYINEDNRGLKNNKFGHTKGVIIIIPIYLLEKENYNIKEFCSVKDGINLGNIKFKDSKKNIILYT